MLWSEVLKCPICSSHVRLSANEKCIVCLNHHNYDIAKQGYINFNGSSQGKIYENKELFSARREVYVAGFFEELQKCILGLLTNICEENNRFILEVGCGEGSLTSFLKTQCPKNEFIGLDISKQSIKMAAQLNKNVCWLVADICKMPIKNNSIDCIIDMLTPSNYSEFERVLKQGGHIIKIIPNEDYLKELRHEMGVKPFVKKGVAELFKEHFQLEEEVVLRYNYRCTPDILKSVYLMTPMSNNIVYNCGMEADKLTIDLSILVGRKR